MTKENEPTTSSELNPSGRRAAGVMTVGAFSMALGCASWLAEAVKINDQSLADVLVTDPIQSGLIGVGGLTLLAGQRMLIRSRNDARQEAIQD